MPRARPTSGDPRPRLFCRYEGNFSGLVFTVVMSLFHPLYCLTLYGPDALELLIGALLEVAFCPVTGRSTYSSRGLSSLLLTASHTACLGLWDCGPAAGVQLLQRGAAAGTPLALRPLLLCLYSVFCAGIVAVLSVRMCDSDTMQRKPWFEVICPVISRG